MSRPQRKVETGPATEERRNVNIRPDETDADPPTGIQNLGFYAVLIFIFLRFSFLHEFIAAKVNVSLHLIIIIGGLSYLCCALSGQLFRAFQDRSTWMWLGFAVCMTLATATSFWKGGSFPLLMDFLETVLPVIFVIPALVQTKPQLTKVVSTIGLACIAMVVLGTVNDDFRSGRMGVDVANSEIQNPNDYAAHLILMLPALAFWAFRRGRPIVFRIIGGAALALCLKQILSSGSRGALLSLVLTALIILVSGPKKLKMAILIGVPVLGLVAIPFVPRQSLNRLSTLFSSSAAARDGEAAESSEARIALLQESWKATLTHPILGVGPGIFMDYQANAAGENGQRGMWHVTHNSYTQVSSECGIPALLLYLAALAITFASLRMGVRSGDPQLTPVASTVFIMLIAYTVCIFFLSLAYSFHLLAISAMAVSMKLSLTPEGHSQPHEPESLGSPREAVPA